MNLHSWKMVTNNLCIFRTVYIQILSLARTM